MGLEKGIRKRKKRAKRGVQQLPRFLPRNFQTKIIRDVLESKRRILISATRRGGKDFIGLASADIIAQLYPGSNIGYLGLSLKSLKKILFSNNDDGQIMFESVVDVKNVLKLTRTGKYFDENTSSIRYKNGSIIHLIGSDSKLELGTSMRMLIITEASRIPFDSWKYLEPSVNNNDKGIIMQISTPYYGSDFNDVMTGDHKTSGMYSKHIVKADELLNADGTRVYSDDKLRYIRASMDESTFQQDYMCNANSVNKTSVLGDSLRMTTIKAMKITPETRLGYVFDLGQTDYCVVTCVCKTEGEQPIIFDYMIHNKTDLIKFMNDIIAQSESLGVKKSHVDIVLPFDSNQELQGYSGKINRYQEVKKGMPGYNVVLLKRVPKMRGLQVLRQVLETGLLCLNSTGNSDIMQLSNRMEDWCKILAGINYKVDSNTGRIIPEVDKRSGKFEDHPLDSMRYVALFYFMDIYGDETSYVKAAKKMEEYSVENLRKEYKGLSFN